MVFFYLSEISLFFEMLGASSYALWYGVLHR